jgi:hypothetical protein
LLNTFFEKNVSCTVAQHIFWKKNVSCAVFSFQISVFPDSAFLIAYK